jgi:Phosphodiester glycosidase
MGAGNFRRWRFFVAGIGVITVALLGVFLTLTYWPSLGAQGADLLRGLLGNETVARLEMAVFAAQDKVQQIQFDLGLLKPAAPWQSASSPNEAIQVTRSPSSQPGPTTGSTTDPTQALPPAAGKITVQLPPAPPNATPSASPTPAAWPPAPATPLGDLAGEGSWTPYIQDSSGAELGYRTFLQPDPQRPYAVVAVVAIDLTHTRLHYVLGSIEPYSPDSPPRTGAIPPGDLVAGRLLATFNGGFKATHGHFGAMADGVTALPPRDGLGTLAIYTDGTVRMGEWGTDITPSTQITAWRQNGPLVIQNGQINPRIYNDSPKDWGYTVNDVSPTLRSGIALSADGKTLYYLVGPRLTMEALAKSMLAAGAANGMQLDINNFWTLFVSIHDENSKLVPEPLLPDQMKEFLDRYLHPYTRDYFYVTAGTS